MQEFVERGVYSAPQLWEVGSVQGLTLADSACKVIGASDGHSLQGVPITNCSA